MDLSRDWEYILDIAKQRLQNNKTARHVSRYGTSIEVIGAAGELAARRYFGLPEELHTGFDGGHDFALGDLTVDVKSTRLTPYLEHRFLQWPTWKRFAADIVLMTAVDLEGMSAVVLGWATPDEIASSPINYDRAIPCYEIPVLELERPWLLVKPHVPEKETRR